MNNKNMIFPIGIKPSSSKINNFNNNNITNNNTNNNNNIEKIKPKSVINLIPIYKNLSEKGNKKIKNFININNNKINSNSNSNKTYKTKTPENILKDFKLKLRSNKYENNNYNNYYTTNNNNYSNTNTNSNSDNNNIKSKSRILLLNKEKFLEKDEIYNNNNSNKINKIQIERIQIQKIPIKINSLYKNNNNSNNNNSNIYNNNYNQNKDNISKFFNFSIENKEIEKKNSTNYSQENLFLNTNQNLNKDENTNKNVNYINTQTQNNNNNNIPNKKLLFADLEKVKISKKSFGCVKAYAAMTTEGIIRDYNEDRVSIILNIPQPKNFRGNTEWPQCSFFGIYDGHGGSACADFLRDNLHKFVKKYL
jgi:hypothetical protein